MENQQSQLKICILEAYNKDDPDSQFLLEKFLEKIGYKNVTKFLIQKNGPDEFVQIESILKKGFDIYFNICDSSVTNFYFAGPEVARYLTYENVPYVGPDINCFQPSRNQMKDVCFQNNIKSPAYQFVYNLQKDFQKLSVLKFPLIVKHFNSAGSIGLTSKSKVNNKQDLRQQLQIMIKMYGGSLVEQFIVGRQFSCIIAENDQENGQLYASEPIEYTFQNHLDDFKYEDIKMLRPKQMKAQKIPEKEIREEIQAISKKFFKGMKMVSYARLDIRMNTQNQIYILEINPLPSLFFCEEQLVGGGDQIIYRSEGGYSTFIKKLIKSAFLKHKNKHLQKNIDAKQICLKQLKKQQRVIDMKLPSTEESKVLLNLYYQSLQVNNKYRHGLSKQTLQELKKDEECGYIFNQEQLKQLET